jgi:hypothetical protein
MLARSDALNDAVDDDDRLVELSDVVLPVLSEDPAELAEFAPRLFIILKR